MKTIVLVLLTIILSVSGFSQSQNNGAVVNKDYIFEPWYMSVYCDGIMVGHLVGKVKVTSIFLNKKHCMLTSITGQLEGTDGLEGETFEIKFHGKEFYQNGFSMKLHFIAEGDKGTKIINRGYFTPETGPVNLKSKCM